MSRILRAKTVIGAQPAPRVAAFSSRGPNALNPEILKVNSSFLIQLPKSIWAFFTTFIFLFFYFFVELLTGIVHEMSEVKVWLCKMISNCNAVIYVAWYHSPGNKHSCSMVSSRWKHVQHSLGNFHGLSSCNRNRNLSQSCSSFVVSICHQIRHHDNWYYTL